MEKGYSTRDKEADLAEWISAVLLRTATPLGPTRRAGSTFTMGEAALVFEIDGSPHTQILTDAEAEKVISNHRRYCRFAGPLS